MDTLYDHIISDICRVASFKSLGQLFVSDLYVSKCVARYVRKSNNNYNMCSASIYYLKYTNTNYKNRRHIFRHGLSLCCENDNFECIKWLLENGKIEYSQESVFDDLIRYMCNVLESKFDWLFNRGYKPTKYNFMVAIANNCFQAIKQFRQYGCEYHKNTFEIAALKSSKEVMQWLYDNDCPFSPRTMSSAVFNYDKNSSLEIMKWLYNNGCPIDFDTLPNAISNGNLKIIEWLVSCGERANRYDIDRAIKSRIGNLDYVKYIWSIGGQFSIATFSIAVKAGYLDIMKWLYQKKCPIDDDVFEDAAKNGNLENMKWLLEIGCKLGNLELDYAVSTKNLETVKWLIENGARLSEDTFRINRKYGSPEIEELLKKFEI